MPFTINHFFDFAEYRRSMRLMQQELRTSLRELSLSERFAKLQTRVGHITEFIAGHGNDHAFHPQNDDEQHNDPEQSRMMRELLKSSKALSPWVKRRILPAMGGIPGDLAIGWVQFPSMKGKAFSLGVFPDDTHFAQVALADDKGRVFLGSDIDMDTHSLDASFMFSKEGDVSLPSGPRFGSEDETEPHAIKAVQGGMVGRDQTGRMTWLASWLKSGNRYTLEQLRPQLPHDMRFNLEYRDALAIGFFTTYMLPQLDGFLIGFGSGNIFRRLNREAPIGAIRRAVRDTIEARAKGLRASGLEDHFADIMREAGALDPVGGLEAVHGAEPLHLFTSSYSGCYFFSWDSGLAFGPALRSLKIEGNLNRFSSVSTWLERNARMGVFPTEDTVTRAEAAQIDFALLLNPALSALQVDDYPPAGFDPVHDDAKGAASHIEGVSRGVASRIWNVYPDPAARAHHMHESFAFEDAHGSEWVYRQAVSTMLRELHLPYRFDVELRSNLSGGDVALGFTTAGQAMMPSSRFDEDQQGWVDISEAERASMSADYNMRVGIIMAAIAFGADSHVCRVSLHIDSIGLEEAVAEQDSAIAELMNQALTAFESIRNGSVQASGSKADPKDGDVHGDPTHGNTHNGIKHHDESDESINQTFQSMMQDVDFDEISFSNPHDGQNDGAQESSDVTPDGEQSSVSDAADLANDGGEAIDDGSMQDDAFSNTDMHEDSVNEENPSDPLNVLRKNPTVRNMVTVTFKREAFLTRLRRDGLARPKDFYKEFGAVMNVDGAGGLTPVNADFDLRDNRFSPRGAQEEPEFADVKLSPSVARILGSRYASDLSIQREDLLQNAVNEFHRMAGDTTIPTVDKARQAMKLVNQINDPELTQLAPQATKALIDSEDTPDFAFAIAHDLDTQRLKGRDLLFSGQVEKAIELVEASVAKLDAQFAANDGVPRYFNSYAERVVYNRLFALPRESTVLIPDNLFYAHMELADILAQIKGAIAALPHLNAMVAYAPAYPLSHLKLAVQLARNEDWDSARAATLNALRVALDRDDAAFAYYRFAYAEWMRDEFDVAVAAYMMSDHISSGKIPTLQGELEELLARAQSQCIPVPQTIEGAQQLLISHDLPIWPHTEVSSIVRKAARVCVDEGMFVPARTLSVAAARMNDDDNDGVDVVQVQFLRSLNA
ncbi:tetratricopeptide repeat protein [Bifidobacterium aquikefiri]|uniref:tetratricopeptide repeat protein n=1 Tax=Bifidobacterium aquikefiri TaxID=1653207 RepID=UPI0023F04BCA|nr:tetratricopeptide repeat protein [Bifidobacterium aquikefiri]